VDGQPSAGFQALKCGLLRSFGLGGKQTVNPQPSLAQ
jgi:hypothetical protein